MEFEERAADADLLPEQLGQADSACHDIAAVLSIEHLKSGVLQDSIEDFGFDERDVAFIDAGPETGAGHVAVPAQSAP